MGQLAAQLQNKFKDTSVGFLTFLFKLFSGGVVGLTLALVGQQMFGFGQLLFMFMIVVSVGVFLRISKGWNFWGVCIFDLICVLVGMLLRMYILVAPGS